MAAGARAASAGLVAVLLAAAVPAHASDVDAAKKDFGLLCATCHGPKGKGDGPAAASLRVKPRDFTDCAVMKAIDDPTIFTAIKEGGEAVQLSKDMPPWKSGLDDPAIHAMVAYIRSLCVP